MNRSTMRFLLTMCLILGMGAGARAQSEPGGAGQATPPPRHFPGRMGPGSFAFERLVGGFGGKVVTGAPFSAQVTRTTNQALADGTKINRTETGSIARDSVGRTRREMTLPAIGPLNASGQTPHIVFIRDNEAGKGYLLNENRKTALTINLPQHPNASPQEGMHMRMNAENNPNEQQQSLGTKAVSGLTLDGTRYTRTIPAGRIGNDKPIVITTEEWYSSQLQMVVSMTRTDPRFGTTTYQLTNIQLGEPPQSMFMVPPDYTPAQGRAWRKNKSASQGAAQPFRPDGN